MPGRTPQRVESLRDDRWVAGREACTRQIGCRAVMYWKQLVMAWLLTATCAVAQPPSAFQDRNAGTASQVNPADLQNIGIDQRLDQQIPLNLEFKDETGRTVKL